MKKFSFSGRAAVVTALILVIGVPATAVGFGEGRSVLLGKRNPSSSAATAETQIIADNTSYGTRQSNLREGDGGGAIYGCRSKPGTEPCIRANNLKDGRAFEFETHGKEAGRIETGDATGAPFTTNATGVATGLNADKVDGKDAADFAAASDLLDAQVSASAVVSANSRGAVSAVVAGAVFTVKFNRDVSKCSYTASPLGAASEQAPGVAAGTDATTVKVDTGTTAKDFHLQVIC